jgi:hypothetical protein
MISKKLWIQAIMETKQNKKTLKKENSVGF